MGLVRTGARRSDRAVPGAQEACGGSSGGRGMTMVGWALPQPDDADQGVQGVDYLHERPSVAIAEGVCVATCSEDRDLLAGDSGSVLWNGDAGEFRGIRSLDRR